MNEKLREIAVKAQVEHCVSHVRLQEFAELIVQECAELMETQHTWITNVAASTLIRNHFKNEKF